MSPSVGKSQTWIVCSELRRRYHGQRNVQFLLSTKQVMFISTTRVKESKSDPNKVIFSHRKVQV